VIIKD